MIKYQRGSNLIEILVALLLCSYVSIKYIEYLVSITYISKKQFIQWQEGRLKDIPDIPDILDIQEALESVDFID